MKNYPKLKQDKKDEKEIKETQDHLSLKSQVDVRVFNESVMTDMR